MTCKDCKGTRKYQPLTGPEEDCRACSDNDYPGEALINDHTDMPIGHARRRASQMIHGHTNPLAVSHAKWLQGAKEPEQVKDLRDAKTVHYSETTGFLALDSLKASSVAGNRYLRRLRDQIIMKPDEYTIQRILIDKNLNVLSSANRVQVLWDIQEDHPKVFDRFCPDGLVPVLIRTNRDNDIRHHDEPQPSICPPLSRLGIESSYVRIRAAEIYSCSIAPCPTDFSIKQKQQWAQLKCASKDLTEAAVRIRVIYNSITEG